MGKSKVEKVTKWSIFKGFVNSWRRKEIRRKDLLDGVGGYGELQLSRELIDTYRLYLVNACYLRHAINHTTGRKIPGLYIKVRRIPKNLTLEDCVEMAYPGSKRRRRVALFRRVCRTDTPHLYFNCQGNVKIPDERD